MGEDIMCIYSNTSLRGIRCPCKNIVWTCCLRENGPMDYKDEGHIGQQGFESILCEDGYLMGCIISHPVWLKPLWENIMWGRDPHKETPWGKRGKNGVGHCNLGKPAWLPCQRRKRQESFLLWWLLSELRLPTQLSDLQTLELGAINSSY